MVSENTIDLTLSTFGPLLFVIFINDSPKAIELPIKMYADDSEVMFELRKNNAAYDASRLQSDIDRIVECDRWLMKLNIDMCKVMHIGRKNPKIMYYMKETDSG